MQRRSQMHLANSNCRVSVRRQGRCHSDGCFCMASVLFWLQKEYAVCFKIQDSPHVVLLTSNVAYGVIFQRVVSTPGLSVRRMFSPLCSIPGADPASAVLHEIPRNHSKELAPPAGVQQRSCFDVCDSEGDQDLLKIIVTQIVYRKMFGLCTSPKFSASHRCWDGKKLVSILQD